MNLRDIIYGLDCNVTHTSDVEINNITFDSRKVSKGSLFVAQVGVHVDGHKYIDTAIQQGATAILCQTLPEKILPNVSYIRVENSDNALGIIADNYFGHPSRKLKLIGITGTNGKTTTVTLLHRMFRMKGYHTGLLSTIVNKIDEEEIPATHTTPDALELNELLSKMVAAGCQYCFMEVSSHSVVQQRIAGLTFAGGIFSNITHDHLDFHKTMANYVAAKKGFFDQLPKEAFALTNCDDRNGMVMVQNTAAKTYTYSLQRMADFKCKVLEDSFQGLQLELNGKEVYTQLVGRFNAYNLTAIYGAAVLSGIDPDEALRLLSQLHAAEGRFEYVNGKGITAIVDYAHTPDALDNVIDTINEIRKPSQMLITVVGCGGDRDKTKRPEMAQIAARKSDRLILTSDNPRTEDPNDILNDMESGLSNEEKCNTVRITDRRQAIRTAVMMAKENDIILIAGKGHEKYQEINGVRHHFDDREEVEKLIINN
ncbi:MAG: UDP-N-acetylmuramoyl-L-alanyl-D-glutamate--2,6-diaminopimelate ligase [Bacteroidales bacterium]|nr:UDP-N-acetylmuramoyl-L-alanyl-D-glutamate--2,6-diaminopimelate ligase [Candidatus Colimorpha pelethequi]